MSLELAEIFMDLEKTFGIKINPERQIPTVGDVQRHIIETIERAQSWDHQRAEQHFRNLIVESLAIVPQDLDKPLWTSVPDLAARLTKLKASPWWELPTQMRRPFWWVVTLWLITPVAALALALASPNDRSVAIVGLIFGPMAAACLAYLTDGWRPVRPSLGDATAQKLIEKAVATFMDQDKAAIAQWMENGAVKREAVNQKVSAIIANCSDLKPDSIKAEHRFVKDLGLD